MELTENQIRFLSNKTQKAFKQMKSESGLGSLVTYADFASYIPWAQVTGHHIDKTTGQWFTKTVESGKEVRTYV